MANVYISSSFKDLIDYRRRALNAIRRLGHSARAMEDYVAGNRRPIEECLADVANCDVYVGIFAFRYGFIPTDPVRNPNGLSMTELEYRQARELDKPCLIFLVSDTASWPLNLTDARTREGENGARIDALRTALAADNLVSFFDNPGDFGELVSAAVSRAFPAPAPPPVPAAREPLFRQLTTQVLLVYSEVDGTWAQAWAAALHAEGLTVRLAPKALFAQTPPDFRALETDAVQSHAVLLLRPPATADQLRTRDAATMARILDLLEGRTGCLLTVDDAAPAGGGAPAADRVTQVIAELRARSPELGSKTVVGLPFIVLAMNASEAEATKAAFEKLGIPAAVAVGRYQSHRLDWRPFGSNATIRDILRGIASRLNERAVNASGGRLIKLQYYSIDPLLDLDPNLRSIYSDVKQLGCIAIVDELSLLNPDVGRPLQSFQSLPQVSVITIAPQTQAPDAVEQVLTKERQRLDDAYNRFELELDPNCEFGVREERALKRWLHASLPHTMQQMRQPPPNRDKLAEFKESLRDKNVERRGYGEAVFREGGGQ